MASRPAIFHSPSVPRHLRLLAGEVQEHVQAMRAEVPQAAAAGLGGIEHPGGVPGRVPRGRGPVDADVHVGDRPEASLGQQLAGAGGEGLVALKERDGGVGLEPGGLVRDGLHLVGVDPHGFFDEEGQAQVEQIVRSAGCPSPRRAS